MACVEATLKAHGFPYDIGDGVICLQVPDLGKHELELWNLGQLCKSNPAGEWVGLIEDHFAKTLSFLKERDAPQSQMQDYSQVRRRFRIRLFPDVCSDEAKQKMVGRQLAPGLLALLACHFSDTVVTVSRQDAETWGPSEEQLLREGLTNR